jgi:hypothetical protein
VDGSASWVQGLGSVLLNCILTAPSTSRMRASAVKGVSLLASAIPGSSEPDLVSAYLAEHTKDDMKDFGSRRLLPLQSVNHAIGVAEAATWVLSLRPALSAWGSDLSVLVNDAMWIAELDETRLLARLPISRSTSAEGLTRLRVACMKLLCAVMQREEFQGEPKEPRPAVSVGWLLPLCLVPCSPNTCATTTRHVLCCIDTAAFQQNTAAPLCMMAYWCHL